VARYTFFGREAISLLVILPIALLGIVTGIALNSAFTTFLKPFGIGFGLFTMIVGHAIFCIVVIYNNVLARLRRVGATLEGASGDLGANTFQTFRYVTFPTIRSSLVAGDLLAFARSFDEIVAPVSSWPLPFLSGSVSGSQMAQLRVAGSSPALFPEWQGLP